MDIPKVPHEDEAENRCPFCRDLPEYAITNGMEGPPVETQLNMVDESETKPGDDDQYSKCILYLIMKSLRRIWSGEGEFPTTPNASSPNDVETCIKGVNILTDPTTPISNLGIFYNGARYPPVHRDPSSPPVIARIQRWLSNCDKDHPSCRVNEIPLLPTRVLDVGSSNGSQVVKLVESSEEQRGAYIALSHCWGKSTPFVTTRDNFEQMQNGFLPDTVPATFRDAIIFSRKLGIRYLWIDSLCIIQGDREDWEREASRMARVYRDANLTLSASYAEGDSEGFLKQRPSQHSTVKISSSSGQVAEVYLSERFVNRSVTADPEFELIPPLDTRGWCLQECYLTNRQIKFLNTKILWSCRDVDQDEGRPDDRGALTIRGTEKNVIYLFRNTEKPRHRCLTRLTVYESWYRMIRGFSLRNLTFASDVLPALSGLASEVAAHDNGRYCAGVWWEDIAFGICWKKTESLKPAAGPNEYITPSWSWASVVGPVEFVHAHEVMYRQTPIAGPNQVSFHDVWIQNHSSNLYGQIDGACIKLQAPIASLERTNEDAFCFPGLASPGGETDVTFDLDEGELGDNAIALFLLRRVPYNSELEVILFGLVVRPVLNAAQNYGHFTVEDDGEVYKRVGFVRVLTSNTREAEYWQTPVRSVLLI
ncbi:heterokaryon incompatibility protein [Phlyctema vagabunda]|uniref:Heterokaryon incompatibility protein n=1 Tax=Phlyctema vagabunda TaxID=108571 RepID=A0ABR4PDY3_9HELO